MKTLLMDTCNSNLIISIIEENTVLAYYNEKLNTDLSSKALPILKEILEKTKIKPSEIGRILVANGPGSFTGIRIGVTISKTYAWALNKKIIPISSLEVMASTKTNTKYNIAMIDARRDSYYVGVYDQNLSKIIGDKYMEKEEWEETIRNYSDSTIIAYDRIEKLDVIEPKIEIEKIISKHENDNGENPHLINPNYLKLTEAEAKLKENDRNNKEPRDN